MTVQLYYAVVAKTQPWTDETRQIVGYYKHEALAKRVAELVRDVNMNEHPFGIDVNVEKNEGEVVVCEAGVRLKATLNGRIEMIKDAINRQELNYLAQLRFEQQAVEWVEY